MALKSKIATTLSANYKQSLFDIAVQEYGSLDYLIEVVRKNGVAFDYTPPQGETFTFDTTTDNDAKAIRVINFIRVNELQLNNYSNTPPVVPLSSPWLLWDAVDDTDVWLLWDSVSDDDYWEITE